MLGIISSILGAVLGTVATWTQLSPERNVKLIPISVAGMPKSCDIDQAKLDPLYEKISKLDNQGYGFLAPSGPPGPGALAGLGLAPEFAIRVYAFLQKLNPSIIFPEDAITARIRDLQERLWQAYADEMQSGNPSDRQKSNWKAKTAPHFAEAAKLLSKAPFDPTAFSGEVDGIQDFFFERVFKTYGSKVLPDNGGNSVTYPQLIAVLHTACERLRGITSLPGNSCRVPGDVIPRGEQERAYLRREGLVTGNCLTEDSPSLDNGFTLTALLSIGRPERYAFMRKCKLSVNDDEMMQFAVNLQPPQASGVGPDDGPAVVIVGDSEFVTFRALTMGRQDSEKPFTKLTEDRRPYSIELTCRTFARSFLGYPGGRANEIRTRVNFVGKDLDTR